MIENVRSIRTQLIAGITVTTVTAIVLLGFLNIKMLEWNALLRKSKEAELIVKFIQTFIHDENEITENMIKGFIAKIAEKGLIKDIAILDAKGMAIFVTGEGASLSKGTGRNLFWVSGLNIKMIGGGWFGGIGKNIIVSASLKQKDETKAVGTLMFSMPLSDIKDEVANFRKFIFFYAIFDSIIIIVLGMYLFSRGIVRPMNTLKETAERIAGGMLEQRVDIKASSEIASFASSFNVMADKLEEKIKTLERLNRELTTKQEQLIRTEKLATVGRLAAGVAHEIGNPLGAILGYVEILKKSGVRSQESDEILKRFEKEILRIDKIVRGLLDFSRPSTGILKNIDVNKIVRDAVEMLMPQFTKKNVSFDMRLNGDIPGVYIDGGMLQQVLLNLFINAKDAMEAGGSIIVETSEITNPDLSLPVRVRKDDLPGVDLTAKRKWAASHKYIKISITDTGCGIAEAGITRIFDPFYSTKEQGKGTGLGLTISLGIIQAYGGDIRVRSELKKGTTFDILLPGGIADV